MQRLLSYLQRFFSELQRRKVIRVAAGYAVVGWIVLQVTLALQTAMKLPEAFSTVVVSLLIVGFPIALVASWLFEFTPDGIKRAAGPGDGAVVKPQTTDLILAGALALVIVVALAQLFVLTPVSPSPTAPAVAQTKPAEAEPPALGDKSIAVLPFANLSPDKENEYFADGLTEELLNLLAKIGDLKVISRTSSFAFKGKNTPLPEIAKQLGVRHILEGSVRAEGDNLRVTTQLIDVSTDTYLWSETYDRKDENIFALQNDIARNIAGALKMEFTLAQGQRAAPTKNLKAYRLFLKARELNVRRNEGDMAESVELYKRAIALDASFAEAHAGLATNYATMAVEVGGAASIELVTLAQQSTDAALKLKPDLPRALGVAGTLARHALHWAAAIDSFSKAAALDPSDPLLSASLATTHSMVGKFEQAKRWRKEAAGIDPIYSALFIRAEFLDALARRDDRLLRAIATKMTEVQGDAAGWGFGALSVLARERGDLAEAERTYRAGMKAFGRNEPFVESVARAFRSRAAFREAEKALREQAAKDSTFNSEASLFLIGDYDAFFDDLDARVTSGDTASFWVWMSFAWRAMAQGDEPKMRFRQLAQKVGLVDYWKKHGWPDRCRPKGEDDFECS